MLNQVQALVATRDAVGAALTIEQQRFVSAKLVEIHTFIATPEGKSAVQLFVEEWQKFAQK